jgi:putative ATPase
VSDLFSHSADEALRARAPLAARMRPRTLDEFFGQTEAVGPSTALRRSIERDGLSSLILYGPAGCGKTSLARVIANSTKAAFCEVSAVSSGVADLRRAFDEARQRLAFSGQRTMLFVDEIHRFSRSQQDALLHAVEDRLVVLIGATTENPFFEVNSPLISRSRVVVLSALDDDDVRTILRAALADPERGLGGRFVLTPDAEAEIVRSAGGDARIALNMLEEAAAETGEGEIALEALGCSSAVRILPYDKSGDVHYDVVSAFIKSMRGSDPDAAVYWLARMIHGGEDAKFIARRIMIFASEDVGNADPRALLVAHAAFKAAEVIGWPECRINLSQAAIYMALAPKSNASYRAVDSALAEVRGGPAREVPSHLRDRHRPGSDTYGPYAYPHADEAAAAAQRYLPDGIETRSFFVPGRRGWEADRTVGDEAGEERERGGEWGSQAPFETRDV